MWVSRRLSCPVVAVCLIGLTAGPALADGMPRQGMRGTDQQWLVSFSGLDVSPDAYYAYQGIIVALNRNLSKDGFVLRLFGGYGSYRYDENSVPGGVVDGDVRQFDAMIGYKATIGRLYASAYVGVDYQDHQLTPADPGNVVSGSRAGMKIAADLETDREQKGLYFGLDGSYSTAFDSYWARARVGHNTGKLVFGPEGILLGNEGYDSHRLGGFVSFTTQLNRLVPVEITLSAGHQFIHDSGGGVNTSGSAGGSGAYGSINFSLAF